MPKISPNRHQVAALPLRTRDGQVEVCLVTTRETLRWTIPKGWPMPGRKDWAAAEIEALEEAGLKGKTSRKPLGSFLYWKRFTDRLELIEVQVYRMDVTEQLTSWKEAAERQVRWLPALAAADMVEEPGLVAILSGLAGTAA